MAMNNYVVFDTLKYKAPHGNFGPIRNKPATERVTLSGKSDITFGPGTLVEWVGELIAPVTPDGTGWGDIDDLRYSLGKRTYLAFIDHYGVAHTVYALGAHAESSLTPMWDGASNEWRVSVRFVVDLGGGALVPLSALYLASSIENSDAIGGAVSVSLDEITLAGSAEHAFSSRPILIQELYMASSAASNSIPQVVVMDELTLGGSIPTMTVA
jgi:hypothetical protein